MSLRLDDHWLWDFWLARDGADYHLFFLKAPRSLGDPELRHWHATIGHARSTDLRQWTVLDDAFAPGPAGAWDDYTVWTGSVTAHDGRWHLLYTGTNRAEGGLVQRIGLAVSEDLSTWTRHVDGPVMVADLRWYEAADTTLWHDHSWRDPWVLRHPADGLFHAFITARSNEGPLDGRGVIGHARSVDLVTWEVLEPIISPGHYGYLEVPQVVEVEGRWRLLFCTDEARHSDAWVAAHGPAPVRGTYAWDADGPLGPFHPGTPQALDHPFAGRLYSGKLVQGPAGNWNFLAFVSDNADGSFSGELIDPITVLVDDAGCLSLEAVTAS